VQAAGRGLGGVAGDGVGGADGAERGRHGESEWAGDGRGVDMCLEDCWWMRPME
jgi:hypothetical protein